MNLTDCKKGSFYKIVKNHAKGDLKQRLLSFGIMKTTTLEILEYAPGHSVVEIKIGSMSLALRNEEAKLVEVEPI